MPVTPPQFHPLRFVAPAAPAKSREQLIAELAYFKAQRRNFEPGHEEQDWLAAEAEVDAQLRSTAAGRVPPQKRRDR